MKRDLLVSFPRRMMSSITGAELLEHTEGASSTAATFNALARLIGAFWRWCAKHPRDWCDAKTVEVLERKDTHKDEIGVLKAVQCQKLLDTAAKQGSHSISASTRTRKKAFSAAVASRAKARRVYPAGGAGRPAGTGANFAG